MASRLEGSCVIWQPVTSRFGQDARVALTNFSHLFWAVLDEFARGLPAIPDSWLPVHADHPFLAVQDGRLVCCRL